MRELRSSPSVPLPSLLFLLLQRRKRSDGAFMGRKTSVARILVGGERTSRHGRSPAAGSVTAAVSWTRGIASAARHEAPFWPRGGRAGHEEVELPGEKR
jgi:hypothetical protein